jgi:DNA-binding NarL/FixJ family response regulator
MIKVFLADDHDIVREGLKMIATATEDIEVCGEATNGDDTVARIAESECDVAVIDVNMPGVNGLQLLKTINKLPDPPKIIIFTMYREDSGAVRFLRAGAMGFINKQNPSSILIDAIRKVSGGGRYITPTLADYLFENRIDIERPPHDSLSDREYEVMLLLTQGLRPTDIAGNLKLSRSTINTYVQQIKIKLGVKTIIDVIDYARENELIS